MSTDAKTRSAARSSSPSKTATPWGAALVLERISLPQRSGDRRFAVHVELLEAARGERLVRIAYATDGSARRGPVTLRLRDLERLRAAVSRAPGLAQTLELLEGGDR